MKSDINGRGGVRRQWISVALYSSSSTAASLQPAAEASYINQFPAHLNRKQIVILFTVLFHGFHELECRPSSPMYEDCENKGASLFVLFKKIC